MGTRERELVIADKDRVTVLKVVEETHDICRSCSTDLCCSESHYCEEEETQLQRRMLVA